MIGEMVVPSTANSDAPCQAACASPVCRLVQKGLAGGFVFRGLFVAEVE